MSATAFDLDSYLNCQIRIVNQALHRALPPLATKPATIHKAMRYSLFAGGKRLRPVLTLAACNAVLGQSAAALPLACAVECVHTYSLIHDDLPCMDDDDLRRGRPTLHKVFGEGIAVLAGDALLTQAFELAAQAPAGRYTVADYVRELAVAAGSRRLIAGQVMDLENENRRASLREIRTTHLNKTAALIIAALRLGGMAGNATPNELRYLSRYGHYLGLAFQVVDDILDATSTRERMGKSVRADQRNQKSTYTSLLGVEPARQLAARLIADACRQLRPFGAHATALLALAHFCLHRQH